MLGNHVVRTASTLSVGWAIASVAIAQSSVASISALRGACCTGNGCVITTQVACAGVFLGGVCPVGDCNGTGQPDKCDVLMRISLDQNGNGVPDECEVNCPIPCDAWETADGTQHDFSTFPLPAGFFEPGSLPFGGIVKLTGVPIDATRFSTADTLVARDRDPIVSGDPIGTAGQAVITMNALRLRSTSPITVIVNGVQTRWDVRVGLSAVRQTPDSLFATKTHANGGTYDSSLQVQPRFVFQKVGAPWQIRVLDPGVNNMPPLAFSASMTSWVHDVGATAELFTCLSDDFLAGAADQGGYASAEEIEEEGEDKKTIPIVIHKIHCPPGGDCDSMCDPDLTIYRGQSGAVVAEADEETIGSFTVANLNDTDCDGSTDNADNNVMASGGVGRNEVDLMKLELKAMGDPNKSVILSLVGGAAKVWEQSTKVTQVTLPKTYPISALPVTLWVEATAASMAKRDIALKLKCSDSDDADVVKATGIWVSTTVSAHDTMTAAALFMDPVWANMTTPPKNFVVAEGGIGLRPINATIGVKNTLVIKFKISPPGIHSEPGVAFDGSRQVEGKSWTRDGTAPCVQFSSDTFPPDCELPNDDGNPDDKSAAPNSDDEYFDSDAPGLNGDDAFADLYINRRNFREFLRVKLDGNRPAGNMVDGSRCSPYFDWHLRHRLIKNAMGKWERSGGEPPETANNDIATGHIAIGTCP